MVSCSHTLSYNVASFYNQMRRPLLAIRKSTGLSHVPFRLYTHQLEDNSDIADRRCAALLWFNSFLNFGATQTHNNNFYSENYEILLNLSSFWVLSCLCHSPLSAVVMVTRGLTGWMVRGKESPDLATHFSASLRSVRVTPCMHRAQTKPPRGIKNIAVHCC